jgi:hypothetical protein
VVWVCLLDASGISASSSTVLTAAVLTAVLLYVGIVGWALLRRLVLLRVAASVLQDSRLVTSSALLCFTVLSAMVGGLDKGLVPASEEQK